MNHNSTDRICFPLVPVPGSTISPAADGSTGVTRMNGTRAGAAAQK
jgi:hypothetical protein